MNKWFKLKKIAHFLTEEERLKELREIVHKIKSEYIDDVANSAHQDQITIRQAINHLDELDTELRKFKSWNLAVCLNCNLLFKRNNFIY